MSTVNFEGKEYTIDDDFYYHDFYEWGTAWPESEYGKPCVEVWCCDGTADNDVQFTVFYTLPGVKSAKPKGCMQGPFDDSYISKIQYI